MNEKFDPILNMIKGAMAQMSEERKQAATNMRLGAFIDALGMCTAGKPVVLTDGKGLDDFHSYRGYYEDLAIQPCEKPLSVEQLLVKARAALGEVFEGYKGGDFPMHKNSILWIAYYGSSGGLIPTAVREESERVVVDAVEQPED